ncbi:E3 ubiquitin-protein ligase TRIM32-like [Daphnia carinata]|uniref:E3 ubiquitin-protein ligase TRIM32-like n=1 Tax=Daphnia carinata TaxID=120202 RepID=UPI0025804BF6|nr:E3 ubiquitin-protein ligase TRIM32-like [Daphnia carinata]
MAVSLSSHLMNFNDDTVYDKQVAQMDEIEDLSTCSVCFSEYNSDKRIAKFLPCFHTFCLECLRSLSSSTVIITCPLCRNTFTCNNGVDNLPSNMYALHIAKMSNKAERAKQLQRSLECWCLSCESVAKLACYFSNPKHTLVTIRGSTLKEAEDLQKLVKDIPLKKSLAIKKHKQVQAHLNSLMESLKQVEDGLKDQLMKNDLHLAGIMSLDDNLAFAQDKKDMTVAAVRETVNKIAFQCDESLAEVANIAEYYESQKRIRILLNLRNSDNQVIPTFSLFEDGFYSNWSTAENLSTTDRNLMLVSHLVFTILKRWKIALKVQLPPSSMFTAGSLSSIENRHPPPQLPTVIAPSTSSSVPSTTMSPSVVEQPLNKPSSAWGPAPTLSYSQVLNLPKPLQPPKPVSQASSELPSFTFRFGQKGNSKFNLSSKFLGEVLVKIRLSSHVTFMQELIYFCRKPREMSRRIIKASPGMFITVQAENPLMLEAMPAMHSLGTWESQERTKDAWDVGINSVLDADGQVVAWKLIFLLEKFKPNNMEVAMLFGKVLDGKEILQQMASRTKQDRFNLQVTVKTV